MPEIIKNGQGAEKPHRKIEDYVEGLDRTLVVVADQQNEELGQNEYGNGFEKLINDDCTLNMKAYLRDYGGPFPRDRIELDKKTVEDNELANAPNTRLPGVRAFYRDRAGLRPEDDDRQIERKIIACWRKDMNNKHGYILEKAMTILFYKLLKNDYIIVRTAAHDDWQNGIDRVIVHKRTGEVICAIDDVRDEEQGKRSNAKAQRNLEKVKRGGGRLRYGFTCEPDKKTGNIKIEKKSLSGLPVLFARQSATDLKTLLNSMDFSADTPLSTGEKESVKKIIAEMRDQLSDFTQGADPGQSENLAKINDFLDNIGKPME